MGSEEVAKSIVEVERRLSLSDSLKDLVELHRRLVVPEVPSYATAIFETARMAASMQETLKRSFKDLGLAALAENSSIAAKGMMQWAAPPLEQLQRAGFFNLFPNESQMKSLVEALGTFESRFRLPELMETAGLLSRLQESMASSIAEYVVATPNLISAIESMRTPWLDTTMEERSLTAFAELQRIGEAVRSLPPFGEELAATLRVNLGDFREPIVWRPEVLTDLAVRTDFYASRGFNRTLTDFPLPAFEQSLEIAGLKEGLVPDSEAPRAIEEEIDLARTNKAHDQLQRFERTLRKFIDKVMTHACGSKWPKRRLPQPIYERWRDKKQKAEQAGAEERPIIEYSDFTDYEPLICRSDNWNDVFKIFFKRPESVRESFQRLYPIRLDTMHARLITHEDKLFLEVEIMRLTKVIPK